jgi:hypothetical protein
MNAPLVITPDLIRRFPFAVKASRITADMEALIAKDMADRCRSEGHWPTIFVDYACVTFDATREADILKYLEGKERCIKDIARAVKRPAKTVRNAVNELMRSKQLVMRQGAPAGLRFYSIPPHGAKSGVPA